MMLFFRRRRSNQEEERQSQEENSEERTQEASSNGLAESASGGLQASPANCNGTEPQQVYIEFCGIISCRTCRAHITTESDIISKSFHGRTGRAFLVHTAVNVVRGKVEDRLLLTGLHSVADVTCQKCKTTVGWTYVKAFAQSQKYKEGKYVLEHSKIFEEASEASPLDYM